MLLCSCIFYCGMLMDTYVPLVILGDPAYPSLQWLMKPYPETSCITTQQKLFNYRQSRARMVVENAFGRLKGRWCCLLKRLDFKLENVPHVVSSCVVLHNMCEMFGDNCPTEWTATDIQSPQDTSTATTSNSVNDGTSIRNATTQYFST